MLRTCSEVGWIENERMEKRGAWKDARNWPDCPRKYGVAVQEDNPYGELRFEGASLPSVKSFDTTGNVPCTGRFSKIFCPRTSSASTSWLVKQGTDLQYDGPDDHRPVSTTVRHRPTYRKDSRSVQKAQGRCGRIHRTLLPREHKIHSARRRTIYLDRTSDRDFGARNFKQMPRKKIAFVPGGSFFRTSIKRIFSGSIIPIYPETGSRKDLKSSGRSSKNISANPNDLSRRANPEKRSSRREFFICLSRPKKFAGCPKISRRIHFN